MNHCNIHIIPDSKATNTLLMGNNIFTNKSNRYLPPQMSTNSLNNGCKYLNMSIFCVDAGVTPHLHTIIAPLYLAGINLLGISLKINLESIAGRYGLLLSVMRYLLLVYMLFCYLLPVMCYVLLCSLVTNIYITITGIAVTV